MRIDPLLAPVLAAYQPGTGDIVAERAAEARAARAVVGTLTRPAPESVRVRDIPAIARVFTPAGTATRGALVFAHGGGWATGSADTAHEHCAALAADADAVVVSVDYRLVPEHPFPAGLHDLRHALDWTLGHAAELGIDPTRVAVGGESAGANLAAAVARLRPESVALQLLEAPVLDLTDAPSQSSTEVAAGFPPLDALRRTATARYLADGADPTDPLVSPLLADDLTGLPPAVLLAADVDPWRDDALRYADALRAAGVSARVRVFDGIVHGTQSFTALLPTARDWHAECAAALRSMGA